MQRVFSWRGFGLTTLFLGVLALASLKPADAAYGVADPLPGAVSKPADFTITLPWGNGVTHTVTQSYGTGLHLGTDRACCNNDQYALDIDMQLGEPVYPIAGGQVLFAGPAAGSWASFGNIVFVDHGNGFESVYAHLNTLEVSTGQRIDASTTLGGAGGSGGWRPHLHFAMYQQANFYNTMLGIGQYGGHSAMMEPFANCSKAGSNSCDHFTPNDRLTKTSGAVAPAAQPAQPAVSLPSATGLTTQAASGGAMSLSWDAPPGSMSYEVQVVPVHNDGPAIDVVVSDLAQVASGSYALRTAVLGQGNYVLLPGSYYSWRVRHFSAVSGWTGWSETAWFNLPAPSSATISVIAPAGGSRTPTIQWTDSSTSDFYFEVQVSSDPQFRSGSDSVAPVYWNLVHGGMSAPLDSWTVPLNYPLSPGTYHARVRQRVQATPAGAAEQGINWTPAVSFQVY